MNRNIYRVASIYSRYIPRYNNLQTKTKFIKSDITLYLLGYIVILSGVALYNSILYDVEYNGNSKKIKKLTKKIDKLDWKLNAHIRGDF